MTLRVFALQFIAKHRYGELETIPEKNQHNEALTMVQLLLTERHDLVALFFCSPVLSDNDITRMMTFVYTENRINEDGDAVSYNPLKCTIDEEEWPVIMECVNRGHLFRKDVSAKEIKDLFWGTLKEPLATDNLQGVCYLFDALSICDFITGHWQTPLARTEAIMSGKGNRFVTASNLSTTLSRLKSKDVMPFQMDINLLVGHLKDKMRLRSQNIDC